MIRRGPPSRSHTHTHTSPLRYPGVCAKMTPVVRLASLKYRHPLKLQRFLPQVTNGPQTPDQWGDRIACRRVRGSVDTQLMNNRVSHYVTAIPLRRIDGALFRRDVHPASTQTDSSDLIHVSAEHIPSLFLSGRGRAVCQNPRVSWKVAGSGNNCIYRRLTETAGSFLFLSPAP